MERITETHIGVDIINMITVNVGEDTNMLWCMAL